MGTMINNFVSMFRRFPSAHLLNIFGLTVAFASFYIIMAQVSYDYGYNKSIPDYECIYRVEFDAQAGNRDMGDFRLFINRQSAEASLAGSPHVQNYAMVDMSLSSTTLITEEGNQFDCTLRSGQEDYLSLFSPHMLAGSTEMLKTGRNNILIPQSLSQRMFGTTDAVGRVVHVGKETTYVVQGVFEDFPENTFLSGQVFRGSVSDINRYNPNYLLFVKLDDKDNKSETIATMRKGMLANMGIAADDNPDMKLDLVNLNDIHFETINANSDASRGVTYLLLCFCVLIIFVAGVNFTNFSLAEAPMRMRSINTQKVLGASLLKLRVGLLAESVLLSLISMALAMAFFYIVPELGIQQLVESDLSIANHLPLLACTWVISLLLGLIAGLYPSWYATSFPPVLILKGSFGLSPQGKKLRTTLVGFQFVVAFVLVIGVVVMFMQSMLIRNADYGYDKDYIVTGRIPNGLKDNPTALIQEARRVSGVEDVALSQFIISSSDQYLNQGRGVDENYVSFQFFPVDWNYLNVMGIDLVEGRKFEATDREVIIVNEAAKRIFPWIQVGHPIVQGAETVIGICRDLHFGSFKSDDSNRPFVMGLNTYNGVGWEDYYVPNYMNIRIGKGTAPYAVMSSLQASLEKLSPGFDFNFRTMNTVIDTLYVKERMLTRQVTLLSLLALVISLIGVFGLTMFESEYRHKEIGIRKIFGSTTGQILMMFNKRYLTILVLCFVIAAPLGYYTAMNWLQGFATKTVISPLVYLCSFLMVSFMTVMTVTWQSWKNANENPVNSIKTE